MIFYRLIKVSYILVFIGSSIALIAAWVSDNFKWPDFKTLVIVIVVAFILVFVLPVLFDFIVFGARGIDRWRERISDFIE